MVLITINICNDPIGEKQHFIVTLKKRVILNSAGYGTYLMVFCGGYNHDYFDELPG